MVAFIHFYLRRVITIEHSCHHARASAVCRRCGRRTRTRPLVTDVCNGLHVSCLFAFVFVSWLFACWRSARASICGPQFKRKRSEKRIKCCNLTRVTLAEGVAVAAVNLYMCMCMRVLTPQRVGYRMVMTL